MSASFDHTDPEVDATLVAQQVSVSDLAVTLDGVDATLPVQLNAPTAVFAEGQFQGLALSAVAVADGVVAVLDTGEAPLPLSVTNAP